MVEGDLGDLTLPSLLHALSRDGSTAVLRLQRGELNGALYFREGALVHALSGTKAGDQALYEVLGWGEGRFRLIRDAEHHPRTVTHSVTDLLAGDLDSTGAPDGAGVKPRPAEDERLLTDALNLVARLEQDRVRLAEGRVEGGVQALIAMTAVVNSLVAFVTARCGDPGVQPLRVLENLAATQPYTQLLGEDAERISIATSVAMLKNWASDPEACRRIFQDVCRALLDVAAVYCNLVSSLFHESREREEWRATFDVFIDGLSTAVHQVKV